MSEPCQLFARVRLSRAQYDRFLKSEFPDPSNDAEVLGWLSNASYYGERYTPDSIRERLRGLSTVGAWVDELVAPSPYGLSVPAANLYDDATQTWTLAVLDFSENYDDFITAIAAFRAIAAFKDVSGDADGMLIYGYVHEHGYVISALGIDCGTSRFLEDGAPAALVNQADSAMESLMAMGAAAAS
jgi:hypothetical protein